MYLDSISLSPIFGQRLTDGHVFNNDRPLKSNDAPPVVIDGRVIDHAAAVTVYYLRCELELVAQEKLLS